MKHVIGTLLLTTLLVSCVHVGEAPTFTDLQKPHVLNVAPSKRIALHAAVLLGSMGDAISTQQQINRGAHELNPALQQIVHHPVYWFSFKTLVAAWNIYEGEKMYRAGNSSWWKGEAFATVLGWGAFGWNERQVFIHNRDERRKVGITP